MKNTKPLYIAYYIVILAIVGWKVVDTLITGGVVVSQKTALRALANQQIALEKQETELRSTLQTAQSLALFDESTLASYEKMRSPIPISASEYVASR